MRGRVQIYVSGYFVSGLLLALPLPAMSLRMGFNLLNLGFLICRIDSHFNLELSVRIKLNK